MSGGRREKGFLSPEQVESFLNRARNIFPKDDFIVGSLKHTTSDLHELQLVEYEEQKAALEAVLAEIGAGDYCGPHPPKHISDEPKCKGTRMMQFTWTSGRFGGRKMYVKMCIANERLALLRIHEAFEPNKFAKLDRPKKYEVL